MTTRKAYLALAFLLLVSVVALQSCIQKGDGRHDKHPLSLADKVEELLVVSTEPYFPFRYDTMRAGVLQHIDREFTYDVIPSELENGILFQGIHRLPSGTVISLEVLQPVRIYFFFHHEVDGGYSQIFPEMEGWEQCSTAPQYDIINGDHGLKMIMYKKRFSKGIYSIPATQKDRACFNMVFKE